MYGLVPRTAFQAYRSRFAVANYRRCCFIHFRSLAYLSEGVLHLVSQVLNRCGTQFHQTNGRVSSCAPIIRNGVRRFFFYIYIYIYNVVCIKRIYMSSRVWDIVIPTASPIVGPRFFWTFLRFGAWIDASGGLFEPSGIHKTGLGSQKTHPTSTLIDFTNIVECSCVFIKLYMMSCSFPWSRGYEKDVKRYFESICPRISAWALFWTFSVKETMLCKSWHVSARRRSWKSKSNLLILAAWGLQEFKGPISIYINIHIYLFIYQSLSIYICASMHLCMYFIYLSIYLSICLSIYLCIYVSICRIYQGRAKRGRRF